MFATDGCADLLLWEDYTEWQGVLCCDARGSVSCGLLQPSTALHSRLQHSTASCGTN